MKPENRRKTGNRPTEAGNASEAYRRAYDAGKMKAATVNRKAKELMDNGKITARIEELCKLAVGKGDCAVLGCGRDACRAR